MNTKLKLELEAKQKEAELIKCTDEQDLGRGQCPSCELNFQVVFGDRIRVRSER